MTDLSRPLRRRQRAGFWLLLAVATLPLLGGAIRLADLATATVITPDNARFFAAPIPILAHIAAITLYGPGGFVQIYHGLRGRRWPLHRALGPTLFAAAWSVALSGLWMTLAYPPGPLDGPGLFYVRLVVGSVMLAELAMAGISLSRRGYACHGRMMLRAWALGNGAATQALIGIPWTLLAGAPEDLSRTLMLTAGWVINAVLAEWVVARRLPRRRRTA